MTGVPHIEIRESAEDLEDVLKVSNGKKLCQSPQHDSDHSQIDERF